MSIEQEEENDADDDGEYIVVDSINRANYITSRYYTVSKEGEAKKEKKKRVFWIVVNDRSLRVLK